MPRYFPVTHWLMGQRTLCGRKIHLGSALLYVRLPAEATCKRCNKINTIATVQKEGEKGCIGVSKVKSVT